MSADKPSLDNREPPALIPAVDTAQSARLVNRRRFLGFFAGLSMSLPMAAGLSWVWTARRCVETSAPEAKPDAVTKPAFRGRLIIVIPQEADKQRTLGTALGEYLYHAGDEALAPLAAVVVECIAAEELELPGTALGSGPFALLLIAGDSRRLVRFELPEVERPYEIEGVIDERIAIMSRAVRQAVIDSEQRPERVVGVNDAALVQVPVQELMPGHAEQFAPALLAIALDAKGSARASLMSTLAEVVRRNLVAGEILGAQWVKHTEDPCPTCGMGYVSPRSQQFLSFYTSKGRQ